MQNEDLVRILPSDGRLVYSGRIDWEDMNAPVFVYPCSSVRFIIKGKAGKLLAENRHAYYENALGILVDGCYGGKLTLPDKGAAELDFSEYLDGAEHEITIYKLMDACHYFIFRGILAEENGCVRKAQPAPRRKMEFYGDSVSAGEVSEALDHRGLPDPKDHNGRYSNSFYSYAWITARKLKTQIHNISQGGIALLDGEGYFAMPDTLGMLSIYDKITYYPQLGPVKEWNFGDYIPQAVIVAIGQNDAHPVNYMAEDYEGEQAVRWRKKYGDFIGILRQKYSQAYIILTTTILEHHPAWDKAIEETAQRFGDERVFYFKYRNNGCGTPGHIRIPEAEQMAQELAAFIETLGIDW